MSAKDDLTNEEKLQALYTLQKIDSKIDEIRRLQGELPEEVKDLEDEIEGMNTRMKNLTAEIDQKKQQISDFANKGIDATKLMEKYEKQQMNVKNNREYDALTKELENQTLELELSKKKGKDAERELASIQEYMDETKGKLEALKVNLELKKEELTTITAETAKEEETLLKKSTSAGKKIEERLVTAYKRVRGNYKNGLAVVTFERNSCGGCYGKIPPQRQLEVRQRKKIIVCEHCGRILVDPDIETSRKELDA